MMGEWSDYFEDFPEENQANYLNGHFDPAGAARQRELHALQNAKLAKEQAELDRTIKKLIDDGKRREAEAKAKKTNPGKAP
jgi:hypothetical protein